MQITEINCQTGEVIERDMTSEEQERHDAELALMTEVQAQADASMLARESAVSKLLALNLTEEEARSLVGLPAPAVEQAPEEEAPVE